MEWLEFVWNTVGKDGIFVLGMGGMLLYITRIKDHIREEKRIDDYHFAKVKEHIADLTESLEEALIERGVAIIRKVSPKQEAPALCKIDTIESCTALQSERFESDCQALIDTKFRFKVTGWMRENGFHEDDEHGVDKYVKMRTEHSVKFLTTYIKKRCETRYLSLKNKSGLIIQEQEINEYLKSVTTFAIEEEKKSVADIKKYRISHGMITSIIASMVPKFTIKKKE